jgi:hypothetical protein
VAVVVAFAGPARADHGKPPVEIGISSQQAGPRRAEIRARIDARKDRAGQDDRPMGRITRIVWTPPKGGAGDDLPEPYPSLSADSDLAQNSQPLGPGSFWYPIGPARACIFAPGTVAPCYTLVGPGAPGVDPAAVAASLADRLPLLAGRIRTSPDVAGLTGAVSWFWLEPVPRVEELTVVLAGETVTVTAEPGVIEWRFGDGTSKTGGAGLPYRSGPSPDGAIVHIYETRCLPGDRGRNPYVLAGCGSGGYLLQAVISWRISYVAGGPIDAGGALPSRTSAAEAPYPVSELRAFLVSGGAQ